MSVIKHGRFIQILVLNMCMKLKCKIISDLKENNIFHETFKEPIISK